MEGAVADMIWFASVINCKLYSPSVVSVLLYGRVAFFQRSITHFVTKPLFFSFAADYFPVSQPCSQVKDQAERVYSFPVAALWQGAEAMGLK